MNLRYLQHFMFQKLGQQWYQNIEKSYNEDHGKSKLHSGKSLPINKNMDKLNNLFIVGIGRSGTSLLQSMLNAHPNICFTPETQFIRKYLVSHKLDKLYKNNKKELVKNIIYNDMHIKRLGLNTDEIDSIFSSIDNKFSSKNLYDVLRFKYLEKHNKHALWVGDKDPRCIEFLPIINKYFPYAIIIHIVRDPRDVLLSKKKADWSRYRSQQESIFANRIQYKIGKKNGNSLFGGKYIEIKYEDLISNPQFTLSKICDHLKIDYDSAMLYYIESSKELVSESELSWKRETLEPIIENNFDKWKKDLSDREIILSELACYETFKNCGYTNQKELTSMHVFDRIWIYFWYIIIVMFDPFYRLYRILSYYR